MMGATQSLGPNQTKWLAALRSGEYRQGKGVLCDAEGNHCCLGVACRVLLGEPDDVSNDGKIIWEGCFSIAPPSLCNALGIYGAAGRHRHDRDGFAHLVGLNDSGSSFSEIADLIERDPAMYFREPR